MKRMAITLAALLAALAGSMDRTAFAGSGQPPTLVELFTSQGCSSCPPADEFVGELRQRDDLVVLSLHVNYWDYIGWPDPFASDATTARQMDYGRQIARGRVYTPQMVIDGVTHVVGSNRGEVRRAIDAAQNADRLRLDIALSLDGERNLTIAIPGAHYQGAATIWLARFDADTVTDVRRGENSGRTMRNYNVVRELRRIGSWYGQPVDIRLSAGDLAAGDGGRDGCAIIVQADGAGPILGVRQMNLTGAAM